MDTKISIIIPAYNICDYIGKCLDSVLAQTHTNLEIIVVDDGSTDSTGDIINEYAERESRIKAIHQENSGVTRARFRGIVIATGEYIGFIDGDDYIEPQMYEKLLKNAERFKADISHCGYQMVFPDGHIDYYYNTRRFSKHDNNTALRELLEGSTIEPGLCNKLYHSELFLEFLQSNVMDMNIKNNEDLLMNYYLFKLAKSSVYEDICPYHYMLRKNSAATSMLNEYKLKNPIEVLKIIQADAENFSDLQQIIDKRLVRQMISVATLPLGAQRNLIYPYRKKIRAELRKKLSHILAEKFYGNKIRIMAVWTAICPTSYRWVHMIYTKFTGIDQKYNVE